jgi:NADH-quinone oxidoreductase subunit D
MRTPSFSNVSALPALLPGTRVQDLPALLASLFFVVGDVDK